MYCAFIPLFLSILNYFPIILDQQIQKTKIRLPHLKSELFVWLLLGSTKVTLVSILRKLVPFISSSSNMRGKDRYVMILVTTQSSVGLDKGKLCSLRVVVICSCISFPTMSSIKTMMLLLPFLD